MRIESVWGESAGVLIATLASLIIFPMLGFAAPPDDVYKDNFEAPIVTTANTWTWVPFDDAKCGDGSSVGLGINPSTTGSRVLIYLEGGGECYDSLTCYTEQTAAHFTTGYSEADFNAEVASTNYISMPGGFFDRTASTNPFKDYSFVYIPYCTGDIHAGNAIVELGSNTAYFVGFKNMQLFLSNLYPTFRDAQRIVVSGSSAGGFGAVLNWWQTQRAFGNIRVDMIDDSGTFMPKDIQAMGNGGEATAGGVWNLSSTRPPTCTTCATDITTIFDFYSVQFPESRGALLSYTQDSVLPTYDGITTAEFTTGLNELEADEFNVSNTNLAYFNVAGSGHVLWFDPSLTANSASLLQFITSMENDSAGWQSEP